MFVALAVFSACVATTDPPALEGSGPAEIRDEVVRRHGREFDGELADRRAGSQGEQAASFYILGHLQQAGYVVRLDGVPVGNLVRSTNLMALPPSKGDPEVVVAVPYDTGSGLTLGVFLELARALHAATAEHAVEFVALGAEGTGGDDRELGSRRLIKVLADEGADPLIITLSASGGEFFAEGDEEAAEPLRDLARRQGLRTTDVYGPPEAHRPTVFERAGFDHVRVGGPTPGVGAVLLEYLSSAGD
jgi:hypothetical protein